MAKPLLLAGDSTNSFADCDSSEAKINLTDCLRLKGDTSVGDIYDQPTDLVNVVVRNLFVVSGVVIFIMILIAGYQFIEKGEKGKEAAKTIAETALLGFIVMFVAYWVVRLIEVITGNPNLIF